MKAGVKAGVKAGAKAGVKAGAKAGVKAGVTHVLAALATTPETSAAARLALRMLLARAAAPLVPPGWLLLPLPELTLSLSLAPAPAPAPCRLYRTARTGHSACTCPYTPLLARLVPHRPRHDSHHAAAPLPMTLPQLAARLEALLLRKPFSQLGGLALDRDVRLLGAGLADLTARTVRDRLARLSQMAVLLGLEGLDELMDYWSPGGGAGGGAGGGGGEGGGGGAGMINWRLSAAEARAVLALRGDWSREAVMALPL